MFKKDQDKEIIEEYIQSQKLLKRYIKTKLLGKGGFAKCYEVISEQTNRKYAAKIIQKASLSKPKAKQKLLSEIKIHKSMSHHYIVNFQHFFEDELFVYILLEVCRPQTLNDLLKRRKRITEFQTKYYIFQIAEALKYIHGRKVIHRDLKLGNIFLTDDLKIKIGDFGLATKLNSDSERRMTTCGTPNYLAPQILTSKNGHSYQVDIWSIGIIAYALLFGRPPFQTNDLKLTYSKIKTCNYSFPDGVNVSSSAKKFITKILQLQPHKRPTLQEILEDEFITSIQIPKSLPLATISIPPSSNLMKKYQKNLESTKRSNDEGYRSIREETGEINSHRALNKDRAIMSTDKLETYDMVNKFTEKSLNKENNIMQRAMSTAGLIQRKKTTSIHGQPQTYKQIPKQSIPLRVIYFQQNPKFGISYMLSSNAFGMRYNDNTCIITNSPLSFMKYISIESNLTETCSQTYPFVSTPQSIAKKVKIINHYIKELRKKKTETEEKVPNEMRIQLEKMRLKENQDNAMKNYVVRSLKTSKAQFFEFNNGFIQVIFEDSSQIIFLNPNSSLKPNNSLIEPANMVTYITKFSQMKQFNFSNFSQQSEDIKKRMNYALSVIGRVKKTLELKQSISKENKPSTGSGHLAINKSLQKSGSLLMRSSSTMKLSVQQSVQKGLNREKGKSFYSTTKLTRAKDTYPNAGAYGLREICNINSNKMY